MSVLLLLRHAQSEWNARGTWQGHADPELSPEGCRQAMAAADRLASDARYRKFDLVVTSDLQRAVRTAELLTEGLGVEAPTIVEPGLRELDVGAWSGCTRAEIDRRWPGAVARFADGTEAPPGGEPRMAFESRVRAAGRRVADLVASRCAESVLLIAHGGVVGTLAAAVGLAAGRTGHLAGYWGKVERGGLFPEEPVDLIDVALEASP